MSQRTPTKWTNMSMDPPPDPYAWTCQVCSTTNAAGALQCSRCGCPDRVDGRELAERQRQFAKGQPYDGTKKGPVRSRIEGRRVDGSNIVPFRDLLLATLAPFAVVLALIDMFTKGSSRVALSRHDPGVIVDQPWALAAVAVGYLGLLVWGVATVADHFDRRPNEKRYTKVRTWAAAIGFLFMLLGTVLPV
jgi:hypothetical protein